MSAESTVTFLCRLLAAWVNGSALSPAEGPDYEALYQTAKRHMLSAAVCAALETAGLMELCPPETAKRFREAKANAVRRTLLMDAEREKLLAFLEEKGVWYMPLKGVVLSKLYPVYGSRQFADNDILFDAAYWLQVKRFMEGRGYTATISSDGVHDIYQKRPVYNFELHRKLFPEGEEGFPSACAGHYRDILPRLIPDREGGCGRHFSREDFYVYFLAHTYKHFRTTGCGLRTLLDIYILLRSAPDMDTAAIAAELRELRLTDFEALIRPLCLKLFGPSPTPPLTEEERAALDWVASSGVYGTLEHSVRSELWRIKGEPGPVDWRVRAKYLFRRVFPDWGWYKAYAPFVYRHRWAVPFYWVRRLFRGVFVNGRRNLAMFAEAAGRRPGGSRNR